jgi:serine/threonine-protein kinase
MPRPAPRGPCVFAPGAAFAAFFSADSSDIFPARPIPVTLGAVVIGTTIGGKYAVVRQLGEGGMGVVYEARHTGTGRRVAVKVITGALGPDSLARFELEAKAAGAIESEHIAQVLDVGRDEALGVPFLVMEYLVGEDLAHLFARLGPIPPELALRIGVQACLGLEKAHAQGIVHRDIKPANLFLTERDAGELRVKVLDFGIAKVTSGDAQPQNRKALTRVGAFIGSPLYMSPEQTRGGAGIDARTDIWSLGVVLYQALTGRTPCEDTPSIGDFVAAVNTRPAPPVRSFAPWVDPAVALAVERALVIDPAQRYQSIAAMAAALEAFLPRGTSIRGSMIAPAIPGGPAATAAAALTTAATPGPMATGATGTPPPAATAAATPAWNATVPGQPFVAPPPPALPPMPPLPVIPPRPPARGSPVLVVGAVMLGLGAVGTLVAALALGWIGHKKPAPQVDEAPSASASAPPADTAAAVAALGALVGPWHGDGGVIYDAVLNGRSLDLRIRDPEALATSGYVAGDVHFTLRPLGGDTDSFRVFAQVRPPPPRGTVYDKAGSRTTCMHTWSQSAGKQLMAQLSGTRLVLQSVRAEPPDALFTRQGNRVVGCADLSPAPTFPVEVVLNSGVGPVAPPRPGPSPRPDAGAPVDAGGPPPVDAGGPPPVDAGGPPPVDAGGPAEPGLGRPNGSACRRDGNCASRNCTGQRCQGNTPGSPCVHPGHCASRRCQSGVCR